MYVLIKTHNCAWTDYGPGETPTVRRGGPIANPDQIRIQSSRYYCPRTNHGPSRGTCIVIGTTVPFVCFRRRCIRQPSCHSHFILNKSFLSLTEAARLNLQAERIAVANYFLSSGDACLLVGTGAQRVEVFVIFGSPGKFQVEFCGRSERRWPCECVAVDIEYRTMTAGMVIRG